MATVGDRLDSAQHLEWSIQMRAAPLCALALLVAFTVSHRARAYDPAAPTSEIVVSPEPLPPSAPSVSEPPVTRASTDNGCCSPRWWCITAGERTWFSFGESSRDFAGFGGHPNVQSELKWHNVETVITEWNLDAVLANRFVIHTDVGLGWSYGGRLRDDDYAGDNRTLLFSDSLTNVNVDGLGTFYVNADFGYRVYECADEDRQPRLTVDALVGYQYWREKYRAVGGGSLVPPFTFPDIPLITEVFERNNIRLGGRVNWHFLPRVALESRLMIVPWSFQEMTDTHFLRPELAQPSARDQTQGGFGVMFDAVLTYRVWRGLSVLVGYQAWEMTSGHGSTSEFFTINIKEINLHLNELDTFRHGALVGLAYRF
jgi:hypothetical protein